MSDSPLPPPEELQRYEEIQKGLSKRLVDFLLAEIEHRRQLEWSAFEQEVAYKKRGQLFGFLIGLSAVLGGTVSASLGHEWAGAAIGGSGVLGLVTVFVTARSRANHAQHKEN